MNKVTEHLLTASGYQWSLEELDELFETTTTGNIAVINKPMGGIAKNDPTMGARGRVWGKRHKVTQRGLELKR